MVAARGFEIRKLRKFRMVAFAWADRSGSGGPSYWILATFGIVNCGSGRLTRITLPSTLRVNRRRVGRDSRRSWAEVDSRPRKVERGNGVQIAGLAPGGWGKAPGVRGLRPALPGLMNGGVGFSSWGWGRIGRSEEHTSELQSLRHLVCR